MFLDGATGKASTHCGADGSQLPAFAMPDLVAQQAADDGSVTALGNFMLAMNAHINRDFSYVLAGAGLTAADGTSHKPDHNAFNPRLDSLYQPVFAE